TWIAVQMFALCVLSFFVGSLSSAWFLARPALPPRWPRAMPTAGRERKMIDSVPAQRIGNQAELVPSHGSRSPETRSTRDGPTFASRNMNKMLEIVVLISANKRTPDPADGAVPSAARLEIDGSQAGR